MKIVTPKIMQSELNKQITDHLTLDRSAAVETRQQKEEKT